MTHSARNRQVIGSTTAAIRHMPAADPAARPRTTAAHALPTACRPAVNPCHQRAETCRVAS